MRLIPDDTLRQLIYRFDRPSAEDVVIDAKSLVQMCKEIIDLRTTVREYGEPIESPDTSYDFGYDGDGWD